MRPRRVDANHREIITALRQVGAVVLDTHGTPGLLDCLVFWRGVATLVEIKDGRKAASARKLTPAEKDTIMQIEAVGGRVAVVDTVEAALRAIGVEEG
jgi:hypothetical protein